MADEHPLDGFTGSDNRYAERREVTVSGDILTVETRTESDTTARHYRLVEVQQQWIEVQA